MIGKAIHLLRQYLGYSEDLLKKQIARAEQIDGYEQIQLSSKRSSSGKLFYCAKKKGEVKMYYLGGEDNPEVKKVKEAHYLQQSIPALKKNIRLIKQLLNGYTNVSFQAINEMLPKLYKNNQSPELQADNEKAVRWKQQSEAYKKTFEIPYPERLIVGTYDNNWVRSKSEGMIYNLLLALGITFVYELPLKIRSRTFYPDFTILSEIDYKTEIRIEHLGMMSQESYRKSNFAKIMDYMREDFIQGINLFYTYEYQDGGIDLSPILDIISLKVRPAVQMSG